MKKVSLICTLKNEESGIKEFLESLLSQSRLPDEIVIVDGDSTDKTVEIIKSYISEANSIRLIVKNGVNIAEGRNIAIKNSNYDIIASTDAGCRIDKDWLKYLIKPFEEDQSVDVVSGWYEADARNEFEKSIAEVTYPKIERVLENLDEFLPSARSIAFKKFAWDKVGGYPEQLTLTAEDTLFDLNLKKAGCKFAFAPKAVVYWRVRSNVKNLFRQYYLYSKGDGEAGIFTMRYLGLIFKKYTIGVLFFVLGFKYQLFWFLFAGGILFFVLRTCKRYPRYSFRALALVSLIEISQICGWLAGSCQRLKKTDIKNLNSPGENTNQL